MSLQAPRSPTRDGVRPRTGAEARSAPPPAARTPIPGYDSATHAPLKAPKERHPDSAPDLATPWDLTTSNKVSDTPPPPPANRGDENQPTPHAAPSLDPKKARLARMRFTLCRGSALITDRHPDRTAIMIGMTYRTADQWRANHIREFMLRVRHWLRSQGHAMCPYAWVLEYQRRGVAHYHCLLWLPPGVWLPAPDSSGMWPHGSTNVTRAKFGPGYLAKYISKDASKHEAPTKGARIFGIGGIHPQDKAHLRFVKLPQWVKQQAKATPAHDVHRAPGGGYVARETGELSLSPYSLDRLDAARRPVLSYHPDRLTPFAPLG